ncbi:MAG: protease modulator HflC [Alphaproteobacteria bacterium]|nr:protease modulator HflC [Alphaproteobacteria bacterium]
MNRFVFGLVVLLVIAGGVLSNTFFIVTERQQALVLRFGELIGNPITEPGIKMKLPFVDQAVFIDKRLKLLDGDAQEINVADRKRFIVDAFMRYRIVDPLRYYRTLSNDLNARNRLAAQLDASLRETMAKQDLNAILSDKRVAVMGEIGADMRRKTEELGIEVVDVRIKRADLPQENSEAIYGRMKTERQREANEFRARGQEAALKIRAEAERERTVLVAEARSEAEKIRGDGDAERNRIFAQAYSRDPEFFAFYRSMRAYEQALGAGDTTMVLSPNSSFFRYFGAQTPRN